MDTVNLALIGCGFIGELHARNVAGLPGVSISAFVDRDAGRARQLLEDTGAPGAVAVDDAESILRDRDIHGVLIATHHDSHADLAIDAASAGKHVFVEKPLAMTVDACQAVERAVADAGVQLVVGFQTRHAPMVRRARSWIPNPRIVFGQLVAGAWGEEFWAQSPDVGGGNVLSQGVHCFDLLAHLVRSSPQVVFAEGGTMTHDPATTDVVDTVLATIRFSNGAVGTVTIGDFGPSPWTQLGFYGLFDGSGRSATLHHYSEGLCLGTAGSSMIPSEAPTEPEQNLTLADLSVEERHDPYGYVATIAEFVDCIRENRPPDTAGGGKDGRLATAAVLASFESIRTGLPVTIRD